MENVFKLKNKALDYKVQEFLKQHEHKLNYEERKINKLIVIKFKQYSSNDDFIYFTLALKLICSGLPCLRFRGIHYSYSSFNGKAFLVVFW